MFCGYDLTKGLLILASLGLSLCQPLRTHAEGGCFATEYQQESPGSSAATAQPAQESPGNQGATGKGPRPSRKLDINDANKQTLRHELGLTDEEAQRIVDHRPYADVEQLRTKHILSEKEYDRIKSLVVAR
jgi:DNA uptake protein ComE-like DNA-binding protein